MIKKITQTFEVRGEIIVITALAKFDDSGSLIYDKALDDIATEVLQHNMKKTDWNLSLKQVLYYKVRGWSHNIYINGDNAYQEVRREKPEWLNYFLNMEQ